MRDNCEEVKDIEKEISEEELLQLFDGLKSNDKDLIYFREPIEYDDAEMEFVCKTEGYSKGLQDATYWCGMWNTMLNAGIPEQLAIELILAHQLNEANKVIQTMNVDMNKEMAKNQVIVAEKNQF